MVSLTNPLRNFKRTDLSLSRFMARIEGHSNLLLILLNVIVLEVITDIEGLVTI